MRRLIVVALAFVLAAGLAASAGAQTRVRESVGLGGIYGWFPDDRKTLEEAVDRYLTDAADVKVAGRPIGVIAPHAGYRYSGPAAGYAFFPLKGQKYDRVVVLAPSHYVGFRGGSIADVDWYATPLGRIPLDGPACKRLRAADIITSRAEAHDREHSLQNELPFLQRTLGDFKLVPIVVGAFQREEDVQKLADAVKTVVTPDTLIVVSSDFTHFGPRFSYTPFRDELRENIRKLDHGAAELTCALDCTGFRDYMDRTRATICGRHAIAVMLKVFEGRKDIRGQLVHYTTSGDITGDFSNSVSYASIVLSKVERTEPPLKVEVIRETGGKETEPQVVAETLNKDEEKTLLVMARAQLETAVVNRRMIEPKEYGWDLTKKLLSDGAVFVTLKNRDHLRGCIGDVVARQPLYLSVLRNTVNASLRDYRFRDNPITAKELPDIDVEISYLTPQKKVESVTEIVVGKHGVLMEKEGQRAVFLPQVATEQKWDRETMLRFLSVKAGLPPDAWKEGCTFWVFEAQVFGEKEFGLWPKKKEE